MAARVKGSRVVKGSEDSAPVKPARVKLKLSLDRETARRLKLEAFGLDLPVGLVVDELVRNSRRRFVLQDRDKGSQGVEVQGTPEDPRREGPQRPQGAPPALGLVSEAG